MLACWRRDSLNLALALWCEQVVAASATLDRSTRKKVEKLLRSSPSLRSAGRQTIEVASTVTPAGVKLGLRLGFQARS